MGRLGSGKRSALGDETLLYADVAVIHVSEIQQNMFLPFGERLANYVKNQLPTTE